MLLCLSLHAPCLSLHAPCPAVWQVLACLRVCVNQTLAAFRAHSVSSIAGLTEQEQQAYMLRFLKEYISAAWHDMLLSSYGLDPCTFSEYLSSLRMCLLLAVCTMRLILSVL